MEKNEIFDQLTSIFRNVFNNDSLIITGDLTADDVDNWDSLTHMLLITEVEKVFSIKFKLKDLNKMRHVEDMVNIIISKL